MTSLELNKEILKHDTKLRRFSLKLVRDRYRADDLVQDVYLKAFRFKDKLSNHDHISSWLFTIMQTTYINDYRRLKKEGFIIDDSYDNYFQDLSVKTRQRYVM